MSSSASCARSCRWRPADATTSRPSGDAATYSAIPVASTPQPEAIAVAPVSLIPIQPSTAPSSTPRYPGRTGAACVAPVVRPPSWDQADDEGSVTANRTDNSDGAGDTLKAAIVPVTPFQQNCSLIWDTGTMAGAVVDPGGDIPRVRAAIDQAGVKVGKIVLTHGHIDHAGGAAELREALGVPIEGPHAADAFLLDGLEQQGRTYGFAARSVTPDRWLGEGDDVEIGGEDVPWTYLPGRPPGADVQVVVPHRLVRMWDGPFPGPNIRTPI